MKFRILMNVILFGSLAACAPKEGGASPSTNTATKTVTVNGEKPEDYFKRFMYRISGKCSDQYGVTFHFLSTFVDSEIELPNSRDGVARSADLSVFMLENGTFEAILSKRYFAEKIPGGNRYIQESQEKIGGRARLNENGQMVLEGVGIMSGLMHNERQAVMLKVTNMELSEGVPNDHILLQMVRGSSGLKSYNEVCPN